MNFDINMNVHLLVSYEDKISNTSSVLQLIFYSFELMEMVVGNDFL